MDKFIKDVAQQIVNIAKVDKVILFSKKSDLNGNLSSFKVCVIVFDDKKDEAEKAIYLNVDSEVPFDALVFTKDEWETYKNEKDSFCNRVNKTGSVIYG